MSVKTVGNSWDTLDQNIIVGDEKIKKIYVGDRVVYPVKDKLPELKKSTLQYTLIEIKYKDLEIVDHHFTTSDVLYYNYLVSPGDVFNDFMGFVRNDGGVIYIPHLDDCAVSHAEMHNHDTLKILLIGSYGIRKHKISLRSGPYHGIVPCYRYIREPYDLYGNKHEVPTLHFSRGVGFEDSIFATLDSGLKPVRLGPYYDGQFLYLSNSGTVSFDNILDGNSWFEYSPGRRFSMTFDATINDWVNSIGDAHRTCVKKMTDYTGYEVYVSNLLTLYPEIATSSISMDGYLLEIYPMSLELGMDEQENILKADCYDDLLKYPYGFIKMLRRINKYPYENIHGPKYDDFNEKFYLLEPKPGWNIAYHKRNFNLIEKQAYTHQAWHTPYGIFGGIIKVKSKEYLSDLLDKYCVKRVEVLHAEYFDKLIEPFEDIIYENSKETYNNMAIAIVDENCSSIIRRYTFNYSTGGRQFGDEPFNRDRKWAICSNNEYIYTGGDLWENVYLWENGFPRKTHVYDLSYDFRNFTDQLDVDTIYAHLEKADQTAIDEFLSPYSCFFGETTVNEHYGFCQLIAGNPFMYKSKNNIETKVTHGTIKI